MNKQIIKVKLGAGATMPTKADSGDWYDLYTPDDLWLTAKDYKEICLNIAMELPEGYEAIVAPRSSTCRRYGVLMANSIGVIDEGYKGDDDYWHILAYPTRNAYIPKGTRIAQFRIVEHQPTCSLVAVDKLNNENRGGLGSTGV